VQRALDRRGDPDPRANVADEPALGEHPGAERLVPASTEHACDVDGRGAALARKVRAVQQHQRGRQRRRQLEPPHNRLDRRRRGTERAPVLRLLPRARGTQGVAEMFQGAPRVGRPVALLRLLRPALCAAVRRLLRHHLAFNFRGPRENLLPRGPLKF
jgi:hypothetical protein